MNNKLDGFNSMNPRIEGIAPINAGIPVQENPKIPVETNEINNVNPEIGESNVGPSQIVIEESAKDSENPQSLSALKTKSVEGNGATDSTNPFIQSLDNKSKGMYSLNIKEIRKE